MTFNIFSPSTKDGIKVGYISAQNGFVDDVTICEANDYAKLNPGTQFILRNRRYIKYLNINEVNNLTANDVVDGITDCEGLLLTSECAPAAAYFYGGNGVGVQGNPVIGSDGALLAIDLVFGGFGYQYPPIVEVRDGCGRGAGAVIRVLLGEFGETVEVYDQEGDFEEYQICEPTDIGYGKRYGPNGEVLGEWDPTLYTNLSEDPILRQIQEYQDFLQKKPDPWWTTRKSYVPLKLTSSTKTTRTRFDVTDDSHLELVRQKNKNPNYTAWNEFMNAHAISPTPPSNIPGSDFAGIPFVFEWEEDFPYDGEYIFRGLCDNKAILYLDGLKFFELGNFNGAVNPQKKTLQAGIHKIRVDLLNIPIYETIISQPAAPKTVDVDFNISVAGGFANKFEIPDLGISVSKVSDRGQSSKKENITKNVEFGRAYKVKLSTSNQGQIKLRTQGDNVLQAEDDIDFNWKDIECSVSVGRFYDLNGDECKFIVGEPKPILVQSSAIQGKKVFNTIVTEPTTSKLVPNNIINLTAPIAIFGAATKIYYGKDSAGEFFTDVLPTGGQPVGRDISAGKRSVIVDANSAEGKSVTQEILNQKSSSAQTENFPTIRATPVSNVSVFNTIDYITKANRTLWRINPTAVAASGFLNQYGVLPFDPNLNPLVPNTEINLTTTIPIFAGAKKIYYGKDSTGEFFINVAPTNGQPVSRNITPSIVVDANSVEGKSIIQEILNQKNISITAPAYSESYAGIHTIIWDNINFPESGNYNVRIAVDDNVTLYVGNTQIRKEGFLPGTSTGTGDLNESHYFKEGNYKIRAELEQIAGSPLSRGNPMALAIDIQTLRVSTQEIISAKSWNENPMGIALTIDAPEPPIPQEKVPVQQEGRCPPSPLWSTRFPTKSDSWYPVNFKGWSKFLNRYALSPVPPLSTIDSDKGGAIFRNSWNIEIPYRGYYKLQGEVDDIAKIFIDNKLSLDLSRRVGKTNGSEKVLLEKGNHTISVEVSNYTSETFAQIEKKIFSTKDWIVKSPSQPQPKTVDVIFNISVAGGFPNKFEIPDLGISLSKVNDRGQSSKKENVTKNVEYGKVYKVKLSTGNRGKIKLRTQGDNVLQAEDDRDFNWKDIECATSIGRFYDLNGDECKFIVDNVQTFPTITSGTIQWDVIYEGPTPIASYPQPITGRTEFISPAFDNILTPTDEIQGIQGKTWIMGWSNVDFPEDGQYILKAEADDLAIIRIDGVEVGRAKVNEGQRITNFNATKGKRTVEFELSNISIPNTSFQTNPVLVAVEITKNVTVNTGRSKPWTENPIGVSAILIPPPCPKRVRGKGVVVDAIVDDPGNGYPGPPGDGYPVSLRLKAVNVEDSGINYNCGVDQIQITPSNGAVLDYVCDTFGRIVEVKILNPGLGFTTYPEITIPTETGINATFRPQFEVIRDPIVLPEKLIQVTDLVGLKQTGYVDGRAYYGSVFYKEGVRYAGFYETVGDLVQVYDTLQESITAQVTTPASAIERSGTDVTSNDPRLNIPGTPENLI